MELVKLGTEGDFTIPRAILRSVGLTGDASLLVETTPEGAILLRPAAVYPIEIYSAERVEDGYGLLRCDLPGERRLADFDVADAMRHEHDDCP